MTTKPRTLPPLPDPPEREPDEKMTSVKHLHQPGNTHHLAQHFGNAETNLVSAELYITMMPERRLPSGLARRYPDLLIALDVDPVAYYESNGYIIGEQPKPPDFVLEVASPSTADEDTGPKRLDYEALGVAEYWRFDETGEHHKTKLAGDRLVDAEYQPISIDTLPDGRLRGHSAVLNLILEWHDGNLNWIDPVTEEHIPTFQQEREAKLQAESREGQEREAKLQAESREGQEREAKLQAESREGQEREARLEAEARNRELEEELRRLRGE